VQMQARAKPAAKNRRIRRRTDSVETGGATRSNESVRAFIVFNLPGSTVPEVNLLETTDRHCLCFDRR